MDKPQFYSEELSIMTRALVAASKELASLRAERDVLRAALREAAVVNSFSTIKDGLPVQWFQCALCNGEWNDRDEPEYHRKGCLAAPREGERT